MVKQIRCWHHRRRLTLGADKAFDATGYVADPLELGMTPHVVQHITRRRGSRIDDRIARQPCDAISHRLRKRIEEIS